MSLFSEMAALKAALQVRGYDKVTFHLRFVYINMHGRETATVSQVILGCDTPFSDFLRIFCEARSHFECQLPPNAHVRRAYRTLFTKHFRRNMFYNMNSKECFGELVYDCRAARGDCTSLLYDFMSSGKAVPKTSKVFADDRLCLLWKAVPFVFKDPSWHSTAGTPLKASQHKLP